MEVGGGRGVGGVIFSFSYMDDSKSPAAFKKEKKTKKKNNAAEAEIPQEAQSSLLKSHGGHTNDCVHAKTRKKAQVCIRRKRTKKSKKREWNQKKKIKKHI